MDKETLLARNAIHGLETAIELSSETVRLPKEKAIIILGLLKGQQPKTGHWILTGQKNVYGGTVIKCSCCDDVDIVQNVEYELYCRNCGARMVNRTE